MACLPNEVVGYSQLPRLREEGQATRRGQVCHAHPTTGWRGYPLPRYPLPRSTHSRRTGLGRGEDGVANDKRGHNFFPFAPSFSC